MRRSRRTLAVRHREGLLERRLRVDQLALPGERPRAERMRLDLRGVVDAAAADTELLRLLRQRVGAADRGGADERHPCGGGGSLQAVHVSGSSIIIIVRRRRCLYNSTVLE